MDKPIDKQIIKIQGGIWADICSINFGDVNLLNSMVDGIRMELGDGSKIRFWDDVWVGCARLRESFPTLFSLSSQKEGLVGECGFWDGVEWIWNFH